MLIMMQLSMILVLKGLNFDVEVVWIVIEDAEVLAPHLSALAVSRPFDVPTTISIRLQ